MPQLDNAQPSLTDAERWVLERAISVTERALEDARREYSYQASVGAFEAARFEGTLRSFVYTSGEATAYFNTFARLRGIEEWDPDMDNHPLAMPLSGLQALYGASGSLERYVRFQRDGRGEEWAYVEESFSNIEESVGELRAAFAIE